VNAPALLAARSVALFGGTFDPLHAGHLAVARAALEFASLDGVVFVPAHRSPLRTEHVPLADEERLAIVRLALEGEARFAVWDVELTRGGVSYTIDTVRTARELRGPAALAPGLVIGSDSLAGLPRWREVEALLESVRPIVVPRESLPAVHAAIAALEGRLSRAACVALRAGCVPLAVPHPASATRLREELASGRCPSGWLAPRVLEHVRSHGFYRRSNGGSGAAS
jgi:nicotinate-nucleotide adenylyltransferase